MVAEEWKTSRLVLLLKQAQQDTTAERRQGQADWMAAPQLHCDSRGGIQRLQYRRRAVLYCARRDAGEPTGPVVLVEHTTLLSCYDAKRHAEGYMTTCERELVHARSLVYHFSRKGQMLLAVEGVGCDLDGGFARIQCGRPERCVCTDRDSVSLNSYAFEHTKMQGHRHNMDCELPVKNESSEEKDDHLKQQPKGAPATTEPAAAQQANEGAGDDSPDAPKRLDTCAEPAEDRRR
ncbi:uncharacterized protein LOC142583505 [Dermacentor variabilis]|uniref:uncharacterized protein LOC142583505 n=1 Tax=Dermacentor variabilis TaxID=34621 RepID=UPI003F5C4EC5